MWNSTSSNAWEYSFIIKGLGFESYVCHLFFILIICYFNNNVLERDEWYTSAGKGNDSGYFQLLASGLQPLHIRPR